MAPEASTGARRDDRRTPSSWLRVAAGRHRSHRRCRRALHRRESTCATRRTSPHDLGTFLDVVSPVHPMRRTGRPFSRSHGGVEPFKDRSRRHHRAHLVNQPRQPHQRHNLRDRLRSAVRPPQGVRSARRGSYTTRSHSQSPRRCRSTGPCKASTRRVIRASFYVLRIKRLIEGTSNGIERWIRKSSSGWAGTRPQPRRSSNPICAGSTSDRSCCNGFRRGSSDEADLSP